MNKLLITETILRDAHQSQAATRMHTEDMLPVLDKLDKVGYFFSNSFLEIKLISLGSSFLSIGNLSLTSF